MIEDEGAGHLALHCTCGEAFKPGETGIIVRYEPDAFGMSYVLCHQRCLRHVDDRDGAT
ncbi:hypothetical protein [Candidatus Solirubrobacter pratensis]|uniref:hypothetical protein n=1 Tax=Candidatus Solirubrobacter pratensis TaxID=1298857 RepID=UPI0012DEF145|nr:hypothetical protein [Candidatus Solirubrobacter pratensis]